jgi:hypothetical protein
MDEIVLTDENVSEVAEVTGYPEVAVENLLHDFRDNKGIYPIVVPLDSDEDIHAP